MRLAIVAALALALTGCVYAPTNLSGLEELGKELEVTVQDAETKDKVLLLRIDGEIQDSPDEDGFFFASEGTVAKVKHLLDAAKDDPNNRGILLRVDSPGGGVTASDVIYRELLDWKKATGRPVVALFMDTAASGGYYLAQAADEIVAHPTTITGSIGVITLLPNFAGLGDKIGVKVEAVKSGAMKDMGSPFRPLADADRKAFQDLIDQMYARFVSIVAEGRKKAGLTREQIVKLADGRVYTADEALKAKLVDGVGYFQDAFKRLKDRAGIADAKIVTVVKKGLGAGRHTIYSQSDVEPVLANLLGRPSPTVRVDVPGITPSPRRREVLNYLWLPEAR